MISLKKLKILTPLQKIAQECSRFGQKVVAKGFEKMPKVQLIAQSGHTDCNLSLELIIYYATELPLMTLAPRIVVPKRGTAASTFVDFTQLLPSGGAFLAEMAGQKNWAKWQGN